MCCTYNALAHQRQTRRITGQWQCCGHLGEYVPTQQVPSHNPNDRQVWHVCIFAGIRLSMSNKPASEYIREQRDFALTLHIQGPKAYHFFRAECSIPLPHPRSLQRSAKNTSTACHSRTHESITTPNVDTYVLQDATQLSVHSIFQPISLLLLTHKSCHLEIVVEAYTPTAIDHNC